MTIFIGIGFFAIGFILGEAIIFSMYMFDDKGKEKIINDMSKMVDDYL